MSTITPLSFYTNGELIRYASTAEDDLIVELTKRLVETLKELEDVQRIKEDSVQTTRYL
jgi:hypothetical protein